MLSKRRALFIGINYYGTSKALRGCIYDTINVRNMLIDAYQYESNNIVMLRDDTKDPVKRPTRENILKELQSLIDDSNSCSEIFFMYNGHGTRIQDENGDEPTDNKDECILSVDGKVITDDELFAIIQHAKCKCTLLFDSCNSGTICDLQWTFSWQAGNVIVTDTNKNPITQNPHIYVLSGSRDDESGYDVYNRDYIQYGGAFTNTFMECLRSGHHKLRYVDLYTNICKKMQENGYAQTPQMSLSGQSADELFLH